MEELLLLINPIIDFLTNNPEGVTLAQVTFTNQPFRGKSKPANTGGSFGSRLQNMDNELVLGGMEGVAGGITGIIGGLMGMRGAKQQRDDAYSTYKRELQGLRSVDVSNPFARMRNPYANLRVNTQQAEFQAQQGQQSLLDIMSQSRGATGGSGVAALAQAMANQSTKAMQESSASIGTQESAINQARAGAEMERQTIVGQGEQQSQQLRAEKASVLTGYAADELASANEALAAKQEALAGGIGSMVGGVGTLGAGGLFGSDRRLKKHIKLIGYSPSGLRIYTFEYINKLFGNGLWQGVMSDEIPQHTVIKHTDGFDRVDYSKLDVEFKKI